MLRFLRALLRGIRPIRRSLDLIATDLHTLTRIQLLRLSQEGLVLPDEQMMRNPGKDDLLEVSFSVTEPPINPATGKSMVEDDDFKLDLRTIFGRDVREEDVF